MALLESITEPADLRRLAATQLPGLADEIRTFLIRTVCSTGGHLGPNLGLVELTIALHRVFGSPFDRLVFDTGHQSYVHKLLTGRRAGFETLRQEGGLSGYPSRAESVHDLVENSHASTALSYADGLAKAYALDGSDRRVVAVVGDGALTGGLSWEALNNLGASDRPVVVVLNDNGRSYEPTVGGLAGQLAALRRRAGYAEVLSLLDPDGSPDAPSLSELFGGLGFAYRGPVDGHDIGALEAEFVAARRSGRPVVVHCLTRKGLGYAPAEGDAADRLHSIGTVDPATGAPRTKERTWTHAFADELLSLGADRPDVVAVSAAMVRPTGLGAFADAYPERTFDVGIAEQHAVTSAAGLAMGGKHPVVAIYATFLNRAFDQVLMDVGLHGLPVTFVLDRAGITGPDGPSHHGMWDLAALGVVPGLRLAAPRDAGTLCAELREAVDVTDGPTVLRFPKAPLSADIPAVGRVGAVDLLRVPERSDVLLVPVGVLAGAALAAADQLATAGYGCTVADPRWVRPVPTELAQLAAGHRLVVTVEDGVREGGVGQAVASSLAEAGVEVPVRVLGLPRGYLPHAKRGDLLARYGLDAGGIAEATLAALGRTATAPAASA
ncbi:1-deoxy-D-xylulose-5-phosphate synthase [Actinocatenispora rupis]|uniref:1-deoxy-D-xylulose-5-phosphate synthase n=1 Tax=Actinocatenispora rupis TaxID=519421 RepID=A0A8J3JBL9_9ACTN|nr:1-deoxy-D-xylulose-5-phosphate synthase [Actinocatenispora rupis]GID11808.1 1-deoxy-D-xylulose-5-phosphate synthase [Actinocatenispora rupis]